MRAIDFIAFGTVEVTHNLETKRVVNIISSASAFLRVIAKDKVFYGCNKMFNVLCFVLSAFLS